MTNKQYFKNEQNKRIEWCSIYRGEWSEKSSLKR